MRFSLPGQTWRRLTEKRILQPAPHGKAHSVLIDSRKGALCDSQIAPTAPFRYVAAPGNCGATPPPGCGALWRMPQLGKRARATPRQPAGRVVPGSANLGSESGLTERRTLPNRWASECAFPSRRDRRMRFSVRVPAQNAPFRKMCLSSPGQTSKSFTEKRSLQPRCHQKAHSVPITSRKGAVWPPPHLDVPQHLTRYGIKDLFVASMKADDKVWEP